MKELIIIQSKLNAPKNQKNNFGGYMFRSAEDIFEAVKPLLQENDCTLVVSDDIVLIGDRFYLKATAIIKNSTGETESATGYAREEDSRKGMSAEQLTGSASSYARKYALGGLFAIDDCKDADNPTGNVGDSAKIETIIKEINQAKTMQELIAVYNKHIDYAKNEQVISSFTKRKQALNGTK